MVKIASLEDRLNTSNPGEGLEQKVEEKGVIGKFFDYVYLGAVAIGTTLLSTAMTGSLGIIVGSAFAGGGVIGSMIKGEKSFHSLTTNFLKTYSAINAVIGPMVWLGNATYPAVGAFGANIASSLGGSPAIGAIAARSAYAVTAYNAAFIASFKGAGHLVENYLNPIGIMDSINDNYWPLTKRIGMGFAPGYILAANGIPDLFGVPTFALNAVPAAAYNNMYPLDEKEKPIHQLPQEQPNLNRRAA